MWKEKEKNGKNANNNKKYGKEYKEKHKIMPHIAKAMGAIEKCGTGKLGAHEEVCDNCGRKK